ncbi:MAG: hypothetical protein AABX37_00590, partial [Nanoarchaeota archaeon]
IMLDTVSNQMPQDSGGEGRAAVQYLVNNRTLNEHYDSFRWVPPEGVLNHPVYGIRVEDKGKGYDLEKLALLYTDKERDGSKNSPIGGFGEGAKLVSLTVLKEQKFNPEAGKMQIKFRSRSSAGTPVFQEIDIEGRKTQKMHFLLATGLEETTGSSTTIYDPSPEVIRLFRSLHLYVLDFNDDYTPLHRGEEGELFDPHKYRFVNSWEGNYLFANSFFITDTYRDNLLFNYNLRLGIEQISPDRDNVDITVVKQQVEGLVRSCKEKEVVTEIVRKANQKKEGAFFEFIAIPLEKDDERAIIWKEAFYTLFGERAVLYTGSSAIAMEAEHRNYTPIGINDKIKETLHRAGVLTDREVISEGLVAKVVPLGNLTDQERKMYNLIQAVDNAIFAEREEKPPLPSVRIFSEVYLKSGELSADTLGYYDGKEDIIYIKKKCLEDSREFVTVYTHERGHQVTGGRDADDIFREFFEELSYRYIRGEVFEEDQHNVRIQSLEERLRTQEDLLHRLKEDNDSLAYQNVDLRLVLAHLRKKSQS